jgi:hypothetical protein
MRIIYILQFNCAQVLYTVQTYLLVLSFIAEQNLARGLLTLATNLCVRAYTEAKFAR